MDRFGNAVNYPSYSEEETVVGEWIDGKPLYERTYFDNTINWASAETTNHIIDADFNTTKYVLINSYGYVKNSGGWNVSINCNINKDNNTSVFNLKNGLIIRGYLGSNLVEYGVTIQYTKTTD